MDPKEISARLHDILRAAQRVRAAASGRTAEAGIESIDQVKARIRELIADLGEREAPRLPPRLLASAADFPEGRIAGTRAIVQHRRRARIASAAVGQPARKVSPDQSPAPVTTRPPLHLAFTAERSAAEAAFRAASGTPMRA